VNIITASEGNLSTLNTVKLVQAVIAALDDTLSAY
jgi:hypothetical protein